MSGETKAIRVLVVDDEPPARQRLKRMLEATAGLEVVGEAGDGLSALDAVAELSPDLVLLDIEMPELSGIEVALALQQGPGAPAVIFATAYHDYALQAFDAAAIDYLVKPIAKARLATAIAKARRSLASMRPGREALLGARAAAGQPLRLAVRCGNRFAVFDPAEIAAVLSRDHYATIVLAREGADEELLSEDSLDAIGERLVDERFYRVHRSALINIAYLEALERQGDRKYVAVLSDPAKTRAPVSRDRLPELKRRLGL